VCIPLCTTVVHNTARSSSDNILPNIHTGCRVVSVLDSGAEGLSLCFIVLFLLILSVCLSVCMSLRVCVWAMLPDSNKRTKGLGSNRSSDAVG